MSSLLALAAFVADDLATGNHTVVLDWLTDCEMRYADGVPVGLALPMRCLDCQWHHTAYLTVAITQDGVDRAVADMCALHNRTRPDDGGVR